MQVSHLFFKHIDHVLILPHTSCLWCGLCQHKNWMFFHHFFPHFNVDVGIISSVPDLIIYFLGLWFLLIALLSIMPHNSDREKLLLEVTQSHPLVLQSLNYSQFLFILIMGFSSESYCLVLAISVSPLMSPKSLSGVWAVPLAQIKVVCTLLHHQMSSFFIFIS